MFTHTCSRCAPSADRRGELTGVEERPECSIGRCVVRWSEVTGRFAWVAFGQPLQRGTHTPPLSSLMMRVRLLLGKTRRALVGGLSSAGPISWAPKPHGETLAGRQVRAGIPDRHQVQVLAHRCENRVHVRRRIGRDLVLTVEVIVVARLLSASSIGDLPMVMRDK